jgi:hypothetical protein
MVSLAVAGQCFGIALFFGFGAYSLYLAFRGNPFIAVAGLFALPWSVKMLLDLRALREWEAFLEERGWLRRGRWWGGEMDGRPVAVAPGLSWLGRTDRRYWRTGSLTRTRKTRIRVSGKGGPAGPVVLHAAPTTDFGKPRPGGPLAAWCQAEAAEVLRRVDPEANVRLYGFGNGGVDLFYSEWPESPEGLDGLVRSAARLAARIEAAAPGGRP